MAGPKFAAATTTGVTWSARCGNTSVSQASAVGKIGARLSPTSANAMGADGTRCEATMKTRVAAAA